jgi:hypothetical protein
MQTRKYPSKAAKQRAKEERRRQRRGPELELGQECLCEISPNVWLEGVVIVDAKNYIIRLNRPEPNLIVVAKGFVGKTIKKL